MNLVGETVIHKAFGEGEIIDHATNYLTIKFEQGEKKFVYPDAFNGFLRITNADKQILIENKLVEIKYEKARQLVEKERLAQLQQSEQIISVDKHKSKVKVYPRANIAFKCNYCDGGQSDKQIGFHGVCSDELIHNNIEVEKRTWCCSDESACRKYLCDEIDRKELDELCQDDGYVCYESQMLRDWKALAGIVQTGENKGQPMKLNQVQANSLCVLTTRDPTTSENERYIFAVFLVDETYEGDNKDEGYVTTHSEYKIKLSPDEAHNMLFWKYHANDNQPEVAVWSSGLHRYLEDEQAAQILRDIAKTKEGTNDQELAEKFYLHFCQINRVDEDNLPNANGALCR